MQLHVAQSAWIEYAASAARKHQGLPAHLLRVHVQLN